MQQGKKLFCWTSITATRQTPVSASSGLLSLRRSEIFFWYFAVTRSENTSRQHTRAGKIRAWLVLRKGSKDQVKSPQFSFLGDESTIVKL